MTNAKYKILRSVRSASAAKPVRRSDFFQTPKQIMKNRLLIDELIKSNLLETRPGSDSLFLTGMGFSALDREEERREEIVRLSVQFWISCGLSVAALVVSIFALLS